MSSTDRTPHEFICSECGAAKTIYSHTYKKAAMVLLRLQWMADGVPGEPDPALTTYKCPTCGRDDYKELMRDGEKF